MSVEYIDNLNPNFYEELQQFIAETGLEVVEYCWDDVLDDTSYQYPQ